MALENHFLPHISHKGKKYLNNNLSVINRQRILTFLANTVRAPEAKIKQMLIIRYCLNEWDRFAVNCEESRRYLS